MKKLILSLLLSAFGCQILAQEAPTAAPEIKGFNLSPDQLGAASNTVNLFTGDVNLPVNLVSIAGRNGLDVNVSISYSSNVQNQVDTWNLEAPTGILGLGWSIDIPKIIADTKQTGTREDDVFYIVEGGGSNRLIRTTSGSDGGGSFNIYETKNYQFWKIKYYPYPERWEITKENGFKYVYGDQSSGRSTLQYVVRWDNWIGNSAQTSGQSQMASAWNLSEIINLQGEKILFEYDNEEQLVGGGNGQKHTEASYLKQITDVIGRKVQFVYNFKDSYFYMEPHTEQAEPDAYQEVYEKKYLERIDVINENSIKQMSVNFRYSSINANTNTAKMLLTNIEQRNSQNNALPGTSFEYYMATDANGYKGFLKKITFSTGGFTSYSYKMTSNSVGHSDRNLIINAPSGFAEPKVWVANDYVVVVWRALATGNNHDSGKKNALLYVYQWVGKWKEKSLGVLPNVTLMGSIPWGEQPLDYRDFQVVIEDNFFAILYPDPDLTNNFYLRLAYKDETMRGEWASKQKNINFGSWLPALTSGDNFVSVGSHLNESLTPTRLYTFVGDDFRETTLGQPSGIYYYSSANNYLISQSRSDNHIGFNYLTEDKKWLSKSMPSSLQYTSTDKSYWYAHNSMAIVMAANSPEFVYRWDLNYNIFYRDYRDKNNAEIFGSLPDYYPVRLINNSMATIYGKLARFDGVYWYTDNITSHNNGFTNYPFAYGDDFVVRSTSYAGAFKWNGARKEFNPNLLAWQPDVLLDGVNAGQDFSNAGIDYHYFGNGYHYRQTNGQWLKIPYTGFNLSFSGFQRFDAWISALPNSLQELRQFKNGQLTSSSGSSTWGLLYGYKSFPSMGIGNQTIVLRPPSSGDSWDDKYNATSLQLCRVINDGFTGKQKDYPVVLIASNDGSTDTFIDYNFTTAAIDPSGTITQYREVTVIPGSNNILSKPNGYTKNFFCNGLNNTDDPVITNISYPQLLGQSFETKVFDSSNNLVSSETRGYYFFSKTFDNNEASKVDVGYFTRLSTQTASLGTLSTQKSYGYSFATGQLTSESSSPVPATGLMQIKEHVYWWEKYDPANTKNILTNKVQTTETKSYDFGLTATFLGSQIVRWKDLTSTVTGFAFPIEHDSYVWKRTGMPPNLFSTWDASIQPSSDWQFVNKISKRDDNAGIVLESVSSGNFKTATIMNATKTKVLAQATNAGFDEIAYTGLEDASKGNWAWSDGTITLGISKTGDKSINIGTSGITKTGLLADETYLISFWMKKAVANSGSVIIDGVGDVGWDDISTTWNYYEYKVKGVTSLTIKNAGSATVYIDDLRFHPARARMTTQTYHPIYGVSSQTDANNQTIYTDYDEFGRTRGIMDNDKNIISNTIYNYKKQ